MPSVLIQLYGRYVCIGRNIIHVEFGTIDDLGQPLETWSVSSTDKGHCCQSTARSLWCQGPLPGNTTYGEDKSLHRQHVGAFSYKGWDQSGLTVLHLLPGLLQTCCPAVLTSTIECHLKTLQFYLLLLASSPPCSGYFCICSCKKGA